MSQSSPPFDPPDIDRLTFDERGLVPCVVQEWRTGEVLMVAWMNEEAVRKTIQTGRTWFWSRSRGRLWNKGETSGNIQTLRELRVDCDADTLLALVEQSGPACHTGSGTCFEGRTIARPEVSGALQEEPAAAGHGGPAVPHKGRYEQESGTGAPFRAVDDLYRTIVSRRGGRAEESYTSRLFAEGAEHIGRKVSEEAAELVEAAVKGDRSHTVYEAADLAYHLLVLLAHMDISPDEVRRELERRKG